MGLSRLLVANRVTNQISLFNDAATSITTGTAGNATTLQNSQCSLDLSGASIQATNNNLAVTIPITFKAPYQGALKAQIVLATDSANNNSNFQAPGTWTP